MRLLIEGLWSQVCARTGRPLSRRPHLRPRGPSGSWDQGQVGGKGCSFSAESDGGSPGHLLWTQGPADRKGSLSLSSADPASESESDNKSSSQSGSSESSSESEEEARDEDEEKGRSSER